jgi:hypothetical protein
VEVPFCVFFYYSIYCTEKQAGTIYIFVILIIQLRSLSNNKKICTVCTGLLPPENHHGGSIAFYAVSPMDL